MADVSSAGCTAPGDLVLIRKLCLQLQARRSNFGPCVDVLQGRVPAVSQVEDLLEYYMQRAATLQSESERLLAGARDLEESIGVSLSARRFEVWPGSSGGLQHALPSLSQLAHSTALPAAAPHCGAALCWPGVLAFRACCACSRSRLPAAF